MSFPRISIITVTYNAYKTIEDCIMSVLSQSYGNIEYIIIDGGSTDGTAEIIKRYSSRLSKVVSEKDSGIYDAMNKGIELSTGDYLYFMGADDKLYESYTIENLIPSLLNQDVLIGKVIYDNGHIFNSSFGFKTLLNNTVHHQGIFYSKKFFTSFRYDTGFNLIADYELNLRLYIKKDQIKYKFIPDFISICKEGGSSRANLRLAYLETNSVRKKVLGQFSLLFKILYSVKFYITTHVI